MGTQVTEQLDRLNAALAGRYRLERELGRGGMATVYLAHDLRHRRPVAIKVLRPELGQVVGADRFLREIEVTARLDHPHILPLLDSDAADGVLFYVMPLVEGESLAQRLKHEGPFPLAEALQIAREVADALSYAHGRGIVHRDIKPENILLAAGHARVADFGIARAITAAGEEKLTETGMAVGTPAYMSPEQAAGGRQLDGRSDLYALACVLYEMLAGEPPYTGPSARAVIAKHMSAPVPRISVVRPEVPAAVEQALTRALARAPADRFASAAQFARALDSTAASTPKATPFYVRFRGRIAWTGGLLAPLALIVSIAVVVAAALRLSLRPDAARPHDSGVLAVLPFRVTSSDSADNYLREGAVDLLSARLTGEGGPRAVDSRTTLTRWRRAVGANGGDLPIAEALSFAQDLGASQLLLGEFIRTRSQMTVKGRLLRVPSGATIAEHAEAARAGDIEELVLVDRWLGRVLAMSFGQGRAGVQQLSDSVQAVKAYLAGEQASRRGEWPAAGSHYGRALEIDSSFALAVLGMAGVQETSLEGSIAWARRAWEVRHRLSARDRAQLAASFGIGPNYPKPYSMAELIEASERNAETNPDRAWALASVGENYLYYGASAGIDGWLTRAVAALDSAVSLDSSGFATWNRMYAAMLQGDRENVRRFSSLYLQFSPQGELSDAARWLAAQALGDSAAAAALRQRYTGLSDYTVYTLVGSSPVAGLPMEELQHLVSARAAEAEGPARCARLYPALLLSALRGSIATALAVADSMNRTPDCGARRFVLNQALADPGYGTVPNEMARQVGAHADTASSDAHAICITELWRVSRGDTLRTRRAISRIRELVRDLDPAALPRIGPRDICPRLLEAALEAARPGSGSRSPALDRLEEAMRGGTGLESPGELANLVLARRLEAQGNLAAALVAVRRRSYAWNHDFTQVLPAYLHTEGRLAALTGDTAGAVRAYQHYLRLRDRPDPGPMQEEVRRAKASLAELVGEPAGG